MIQSKKVKLFLLLITLSFSTANASERLEIIARKVTSVLNLVLSESELQLIKESQSNLKTDQMLPTLESIKFIWNLNEEKGFVYDVFVEEGYLTSDDIACEILSMYKVEISNKSRFVDVTTYRAISRTAPPDEKELLREFSKNVR